MKTIRRQLNSHNIQILFNYFQPDIAIRDNCNAVKSLLTQLQLNICNVVIWFCIKWKHVWVSQETIGKMVGKSTSAINRNIGKLVKLGLISKIKRHKKTCLYLLTPYLKDSIVNRLRFAHIFWPLKYRSEDSSQDNALVYYNNDILTGSLSSYLSNLGSIVGQKLKNTGAYITRKRRLVLLPEFMASPTQEKTLQGGDSAMDSYDNPLQVQRFKENYPLLVNTFERAKLEGISISAIEKTLHPYLHQISEMDQQRLANEGYELIPAAPKPIERDIKLSEIYDDPETIEAFKKLYNMARTSNLQLDKFANSFKRYIQELTHRDRISLLNEGYKHELLL